jgi:hypothetical protein
MAAPASLWSARRRCHHCGARRSDRVGGRLWLAANVAIVGRRAGRICNDWEFRYSRIADGRAQPVRPSKMGISYDLHNNPGTNREYVSPRLYFNACAIS